MEKTVDYLYRIKWVSYLSVLSLSAFIVSLVLIAIAGPATTNRQLEMAIGFTLALVLVPSFIAMVAATVYVAKARKSLVDWGMFLIFIWVIPYLGVTLYLGVASVWKRVRRFQT